MSSLLRAVSLFFTILFACWGGVAAQLQGCYKANRNDFSTSGGMTVNYDVATYTGTQITNILDVNLASGLHCRCTCHAGLSYGTNTYTITSPSYCETPAQGCVCTSPTVGTTFTYSTGTDAQIGQYLQVTTSGGQTETLASRGSDYPGTCPTTQQLNGCYKGNRNDFISTGGATTNFATTTFAGTSFTNVVDITSNNGRHCRCTCHTALSYGTANSLTYTSPSYCDTPAQGCVCYPPAVGTAFTYSTGTNAQIGKYLRVTTSSGQTSTLASRGSDYPGACPGDSGSSSSSSALVAVIATVSILGAAGAGAAFYYCLVYKSGEKMAIASSATSGVV